MLQSSVDMVARAASGQVSPSAVFADMGQLVLDARREALTPIRGDLTGALGLLFTVIEPPDTYLFYINRHTCVVKVPCKLPCRAIGAVFCHALRARWHQTARSA
jgi:hypothetical protein